MFLIFDGHLKLNLNIIIMKLHKQSRLDEAGFTILELLIVILLVLILLTLFLWH